MSNKCEPTEYNMERLRNRVSNLEKRLAKFERAVFPMGEAELEGFEADGS